MKPILIGALCLVVCGAAIAPQAQRLQFSPQAGSSLRTEYERVFALELGETSTELTYDGERQESPDVAQMGYSMKETESIVYSDTFGVEDDAILGIQRQFETIGNLLEEQTTDPTGEQYDKENKGTSELEGETVTFARDSSQAEFEVGFGESSLDLDDSLLEELVARADLAGFLPEQEVAVGDTWEVPLPAFIQLTNLSGDLSVVQEGEDPDKPDDGYGEQFDENLKGSFQAELVEFVQEDGVRLAVVRMHADLETTIETTTELDAEDAEGTEEEVHSFEFELDGFLRWDMTGKGAGRLHLAGDITLETGADKTYTFEGHELVIHETQEFAGSLDFLAVVE